VASAALIPGFLLSKLTGSKNVGVVGGGGLTGGITWVVGAFVAMGQEIAPKSELPKTN
jgi:hypothetical protein